MREAGEIISIYEGFAEISITAKDSCSSCRINGMCHMTGTANRQIRLPLNGLNVEVGDLVEIDTPARSLLTASFLIFILPVLLSGLAYFLIFHLTQKNNLAIAGFFGCFILSEILIFLLDRMVGRRPFFEPKIIGKVHSKYMA